MIYLIGILCGLLNGLFASGAGQVLVVYLIFKTFAGIFFISFAPTNPDIAAITESTITFLISKSTKLL